MSLWSSFMITYYFNTCALSFFDIYYTVTGVRYPQDLNCNSILEYLELFWHLAFLWSTLWLQWSSFQLWRSSHWSLFLSLCIFSPTSLSYLPKDSNSTLDPYAIRVSIQCWDSNICKYFRPKIWDSNKYSRLKLDVR